MSSAESRPYHLNQGGENLGQMTREDILAQLATGHLQPHALCWRLGMAEWLPISTLQVPEDPAPQPEAQAPIFPDAATPQKPVFPSAPAPVFPAAPDPVTTPEAVFPSSPAAAPEAVFPAPATEPIVPPAKEEPVFPAP
ncbi:MAG: GYF domain-containing protein, partial [Prosthecobacter sp.]|nr:GYF domain-containing protein [Prosthecobacter sp.]